MSNGTTVPAPRIGDRVAAERWYVAPAPAGGWVDHETGLIYDSHGSVVSIDDNTIVPHGTEGTVTRVTDQQVSVDWDNGSRLNLCVGVDQWTPLGSGS